MKKYPVGKHAGFTMVELVVVMVIVGILVVIAVPEYRNYIQRGRAQEGYALLGMVISAQKMYYAEYGNFYAGLPDEGYCPTLEVNAAGNTYHDTWSYGTFEDNSGQVETVADGDPNGYEERVAAIFAADGPTKIGDSVIGTEPW